MIDLMTIDEKTKLPIPSPYILTLKCFAELWRRKLKVEGDYDGSNKAQNRRIMGYIHFQCVFDSRFKLMKEEDRNIKIKKILGLQDEWQPDELVRECMVEYSNLQVTASSELVASLEGSTAAIAKYVTHKIPALEAGTLDPDDVKKIMDIMDRAPDTVTTISKAKAVLLKERDAMAKGRKDRTVNLFEMPDEK